MSETKIKQPGRVKSALLSWLGVPVSLVDGSFWAEWSGAKNYAGKTVTVNSALQLSAAWACVRLISETLSTLPLNLYDDSGQVKTMARDHPLYRLLHTQPNADMTAAVFWQAYVASLLLWGNAYVEIHRSGGVITSLEFLLPQFVTRKRTSLGAVEWSYADPFAKATRKIVEAQMWHTPAFTTDGVTGLSPITLGANVIGSAMAADEASAHTFKNGMKAAGLVTMDVVLKPEQREDVRQHVRKVSTDGGVMVLEKGSAFQQLTMNPQDAELLSTRSFNVEEICRWFRVPPFMVGHSEKSTSWGTGIEQQMIGFVTFVLRPWCVRIEQSIRKSLMTPAEKQRYQAEFAMEGLLRGDSAARGQFYSTMVQNGIYTRNNVRRLENLEPVEGGDELTVQSNMIPIGMLGQGTTAQDALKNWLGIEDKT
ncbi:phage portal protein [Alcaligenes ammonioxydans]|uniref:phage portal protein n=1 Tax=Alcaligenes ammonioxydans TaxID=2582914 RepID=UPI003D197067